MYTDVHEQEDTDCDKVLRRLGGASLSFLCASKTRSDEGAYIDVRDRNATKSPTPARRELSINEQDEKQEYLRRECTRTYTSKKARTATKYCDV